MSKASTKAGTGGNEIDPRRVEYLPVDELKMDPRNPKAHDQDTINASLGRFGVLDLIVKDERTGHIVSGHGRQKAFQMMQERGESPPEGVTLDDQGRWLVPVVTGWASRTDSEASAALIALNRSTELGGWVDDSLLDLLEDLSDEGEDGEGLVGVGYGDEDIQLLREQVDAVTQNSTFDTETEGSDQGPTSFNSAEGWGDHDEFVDLKVSMSADERKQVLAWLNELKGTLELDTHAEVLLHLAQEAGHGE